MPKGVSKEEKTAHKSLVIHEINVGPRQFNNLSSHHKVNSAKSVHDQSYYMSKK